MYIKYNNKNYNCNCRISGTSVTYNELPDDFPAPVSGSIILCAEDGFVMRTDSAEDYLRQIFIGGTLTLTNTPEPEPLPEPDEPEHLDDNDGPVTWDELAEAYTEGVNSLDK